MPLPLLPLLLLGGGALLLASSPQTPASGPAPASPGAGGLNSSGLLGVENVNGVLRYRADVAAGLLVGALAARGLGPPTGPNGQKRGLVPYAPGLENAANWIANMLLWGFAVLISADGREPGELWACTPSEAAVRASASEGLWAVFLDPTQKAAPVQAPQQQALVPQFGQQQGGVPQFQAPPGQGGPPGWSGAPSVQDPSGGYRLRDDYAPTFANWLATQAAVPMQGQPGVVGLVPAAQSPGSPNALAWSLQQAQTGAYIFTPRAQPSALRAGTAADAPNAAGPSGQWIVVAAPLAQQFPALGGQLGGLLGQLGGAFGQQPQQPPQVPQQPQGGPVPVQVGPVPAGPAVPPFVPPQQPQGGPLGGLFGGQDPAGLLGQLGGLLGGQQPQQPPQVPQQPQGGPVPPGLPAPSPTPGIDALPPDAKAAILAAVSAGDATKLEQMAAAMQSSNPGVAAELRKIAIDIRASKRMSAIATGNLVVVRLGDNPSHWAQWYTGDGNRWRELLKFNGIGTVQVGGVTQPDPKRWYVGAEILLPPDWPGAKGMPPVLKSGARAPAPPPRAPAGPPAPPAAPPRAAAPPASPYPAPGPMGESVRVRR